MSSCLVTGGASFIGSHLVDELVARGCSCRVFDKLSTGSRLNLTHILDRVEFIEGDVRDLETVRRTVEGLVKDIPC